MAADEIAAGRLVEVLAGNRPAPMPIHAVMPANRLVPARVRVLLDALAELGRNDDAGPRSSRAQRKPM